MGFRFRKSVKAGPFRMTFSKSGVGGSVGVKGFRVTKKAGGGIRTTASIPGTGISYVAERNSKKKKKTSAVMNNGLNQIEARSTPAYSSDKNKWVALALCATLGFLGAHRFYVGKTGTGLLWLFTGGMLFVGWIADCISIVNGSFRDGANQPLVQ